MENTANRSQIVDKKTDNLNLSYTFASYDPKNTSAQEIICNELFNYQKS